MKRLLHVFLLTAIFCALGTLCPTQHRINESVVLTLVADMLRAIAAYSKHDRAEFVKAIHEAQNNRQTADISKKKSRLTTIQRRVGELEKLTSPSFTATYEIVPIYPIGEIPADLYSADVLSSADGTAAVVVISRDNSEAADYNPNQFNSTEGDFYERPLALSSYERDMIALAKAHSSKVIVLLNTTNPVEIEELKQDAEIDANFIQNGGDDYDAMDSIMAPVYATNDGPVGYTFDQMANYAVRWSASMSDEPTYVSGSETYAKYAMNTLPTEPVVAATFNKELVAREGEIMGEDSLWANSHEYHAPGLNLHRTPYCARNHEYYSEDAVLTALMGDTLCRSAQPKGVTMCPKHLAFNHQELNRSGVSTFMTEQAARENELRAFQMVFSNNSASGVMTAFNRAGTVYSGAHSGLQEQILRTEWGYKGWVVTDMVNGPEYMNWRDAVAGGGLVALSSTAYDTSKIGPMISDANIKAIQEDTFFQLKMKEGLKYYLYTIAGNNVMNGYNSETEVVYFMTWWQKALIGVDVALGLITAAVLVKHFLVTKKGAKES